MTKRRQSLRPPDPRPCFGCTWCGPTLKLAEGQQTLCPFCRLLEGQGWFLRDDKRAKKKFFTNQGQQRQHTSVRDFLVGSTVCVGKTIATLSPEERASLFVGLHPIDGANMVAKSAAVSKRSKKTQGTKRAAPGGADTAPPLHPSAPSTQPFAFSPPSGEHGDGKRPKRTPKSAARVDTATNAAAAAACRTEQGFSCPRCATVCPYDARACHRCGLACFYEAGTGAVMLKELGGPAGPPAGGVQEGTSPSSVGALTMPRVALPGSDRCPGHLPAAAHQAGPNRPHSPQAGIADRHAEDFPAGWVMRWIPRPDGKCKDMYYYSARKRFAFRSKPAAQRFLALLEDTGGDEAAAILLMNKKATASREAEAIIAAVSISSNGAPQPQINSDHQLPDERNASVERLLDLLADIHNARIHACLVEDGLRELVNMA